MRFARICAAAMLFLLPSLVFAEPTVITLDEAIHLAHSNNLSLQSNRIDVNAARRDQDTAWNLFLPTVRATLSNAGATELFHDTNKLTNPVGYAQKNYISGLNAGLNVSITLNPAVKQQLQSYNLGYSLQEVTYEQARREIERNVTKSFYYLLAERENLLLQEQNIIQARKQHEQVAIRFENGLASELEVLSAELAVQRLIPSLGQSRNTYEGQLMAFKVMLGLDLESEIELQGSLPDQRLTTDERQLRQQIGSSLTLRIMDVNVQSLENSKILQHRYETAPSLSISGDYRINTAGSAGGTATEWADSLQYTVAVSIPLDAHIPNSRSQVSLAKIQDSIDKLRLARMQTVIQLEQSLLMQVRTLENLQEQIGLAKANRELAQRVYGMKIAQFESGYTDALELEKAQGDVLSADQTILYLQYQYASALVDLAYDLNLELDQL